MTNDSREYDLTWPHCATVPVAVEVGAELVLVADFVAVADVVVAVCVVVAGPYEQGEPVNKIW